MSIANGSSTRISRGGDPGLDGAAGTAMAGYEFNGIPVCKVVCGVYIIGSVEKSPDKTNYI
jgi:hypothetical protein